MQTRTLACTAGGLIVAFVCLTAQGVISAPLSQDAAPRPAPVGTVFKPETGKPVVSYVPTPAELRVSEQNARQLASRLQGRVFRASVTPHWFADNTRFWYRNDLLGGSKEFILVDAEQGTRQPAFDHQKLAAALSKAAGASYQANRLPFDRIEFLDGNRSIRFQVKSVSWRCDLTTYECARSKQPAPPQADEPAGPVEDDPDLPERAGEGCSPLAPRVDGHSRSECPTLLSSDHPDDDDADQPPQKKKGGKKFGPRPPTRELTSPDGRWTAVVKSSNVVLRDRDGKETPLTTNGVENNAYGSFGWSPDSKTLVAYRTEPGENQIVYRIETSPRDQLPAKLHQGPYPRPGDKFPAHEMWLFDVEAKEPIKVDVERIDFRGVPLLRWKKAGTHFTFEKADRGHQRYRVIEVEARTGKTRNLIDEKTDTVIWTAHPPGGKTRMLPGFAVTYLKQTEEILLVSQRDGWKHMYLIDGSTGAVKHQITKGPWVVRVIDRIDESKRQIWFRASGKHADQDPYLLHYYRVNFDGSGLVALTEGNGSHTIAYSPDGKYLIDTYSRLDMAPVTELRRVSDGKLVCGLEKADTSALEEAGWRAPEVFTAKGRDGRTDIWGVVYRPQKFDPNRKYPVIEYIYAGPHDSHVPKRFSAYRNLMALAELGFIVVQIDGMGTANRSRAFHDVCWKNLAD
ncbi:MAG: S9 family peptidase, partial [Gemmataceae bacterium]|nr:S9 family peptidase [Gemmataceae bacterium]